MEERGAESVEKKPLSFGFSKRQEIKHLGTSAVVEHVESVDDSRDFVLSVEKNEVQSTKPVQNKNKTREYVIPLINKNRWRLNDAGDDKPFDNQQNLELIAAKEILEDSARLNGDWEERGVVDTSKAIPLLMQNQVPEGFETDEKLNVDIRPEEPKDADYDEIPIEQFGLAILRGMGWNEGKGIGKNAKMIAPIEAQLRPKGLGLGADKNNEQSKEKTSKSQKPQENEEKLELKCGTRCVILSGPNKDLYGTVEGLDEDNARAMIKLSLSGKVVNVMQCSIRLVSKEDFEKHSKYLNKLKVDKFKNEEEYKKSLGQEDEHKGVDFREKDEKYNGHSRGSKHHPDFREDDSKYDDRYRDEDSNSKKNKRSKLSSDEYEEKHKRHKHKKHHKIKKSHKKSKSGHSRDYDGSSSDHLPSDNEIQRSWLQKDLRVRIVDKNLKGGKYYKEKVIVEDVMSAGLCVCKTDDGKVIDNVSQSSLETVIPRTDNAVVFIVSGSSKGQIGQIMKRDKSKCLALVQLLIDRDVVLRLQYEEMCEYVGDVQYME